MLVFIGPILRPELKVAQSLQYRISFCSSSSSVILHLRGQKQCYALIFGIGGACRSSSSSSSSQSKPSPPPPPPPPPPYNSKG